MLYKQITWWPDAWHVYDGEIEPKNRIGVVNRRVVRINGKFDRIIWIAHNVNFFQVPGEFSSRAAAAEAIPRGPVHQPIEAFSGH